MKRRHFIAATGVGLAASAVAAPAIAQSAPEVKWRLTSSFPKSLDTIYGAAETVSKQVAEMTDNKFQIQVFAAGEIAPALAAADAASNGSVEMCHTVSYYYVGKDPTFAVASSVPFGMNARQQNAWLQSGGGNELFNEFYKKFNLHGIQTGNTGAQMGGWFRKEIKTVADLNGLKMRIGGIAGQVLQKLGVVPQQIGGGDIYPALERGTIDAAEFSGPHDDEKLGFQKVAKYYYYPGWWEGCANVPLVVNMDKWNALPAHYKAVVEAACTETLLLSIAKYDNQNPDALFRLVASGAELRGFPQDVMQAAFKEAFALYGELAASNANFKKFYDSWLPYWKKEHVWFRVAELPFDAFVSNQAQAQR